MGYRRFGRLEKVPIGKRQVQMGGNGLNEFRPS